MMGDDNIADSAVTGAAAGGNNIKVVCRFRPQNKREIAEGGVPVTEFDDDFTTVKFQSKEYPGSFTFDKVFHWETSQAQMFEYTAAATIEDVMRGYNGTLFAYGQTGSGKTHTMMGDMDSSEMRGLTPRLVESIFQTIMNAPSNLEFTVKVSFLEIYMERIKDLLNPVNDNLPIHEEKHKGVYVKGLLEVFVGSVDEVFEAMLKGQACRVTSATNMNAESSRSHSIFILHVGQKDLNTGSIKNGKLSLVDLAGSEKIGKTGATGQTLEEAKKINKSLSALGMVINSLTDGKSSHVPYRDSKLTRILQESLGGNSRTTLIINCSPSSFNEAETISTLRFGMRAKTIKNKAKINAELSPNELKHFLKKAKVEISKLQNYSASVTSEVIIWRTGGKVPQKDWVTLSSNNSISSSLTVPEFQKPIKLLPTLAENGLDSSSVSSSSSTSVSPPDSPIIGPVTPLLLDEREEFLKRENELSDSLEEKESQVSSLTKELEKLKSEVEFLKKKDHDTSQEAKKMTSTWNQVKIQLEKTAFENKESQIIIDSLKDANKELLKEVNSLKEQMLQLEINPNTFPSQASSDLSLDNPEVKGRKMVEEFDPTPISQLSEKESGLIELVEKLPKSLEIDCDGDSIADLKSKNDSLSKILELAEMERETMKDNITRLEREYEELLDQSVMEDENHLGFDGAIVEFKHKLETQYAFKNEIREKELAEIRHQLSQKEAEFTQNKNKLEELININTNLQSMLEKSGPSVSNNLIPSSTVTDSINEDFELRKELKTQLLEFHTLKNKWSQDFQERCAKVVELENCLYETIKAYSSLAETPDFKVISQLEKSLSETREKYNNLLKSSNTTVQSQKQSFLNKNVTQLSQIQKQLVEQNNTLKKDLLVGEKKLLARNERISVLENMNAEFRLNLEKQAEQFEKDLAELKNNLQETFRGQSNANANNSYLTSARIAKPLRGGGARYVTAEEEASTGSDVDMPTTPRRHNLSTKRSSWYLNLLKK